MNFISRITSGKENLEKVAVTLSPGTFSIVRDEESPKGHRELIFKNAVIRLVRTTRKFYLRIQDRDIELDNEDELRAEADDESVLVKDGDQITFLLQRDLELSYHFGFNGGATITWRDIDSDDGDMFEFVCSSGISENALEKFQRIALEAQGGQKEKEDSLTSTKSSGTIYDSNSDHATKISEKGPIHQCTTSKNNLENLDESSAVLCLSSSSIIQAAECDLKVYDSVEGVFVSSEAFKKCTVVIIKENKWRHFLEVRKGSRAILGTAIDGKLNPFTDMSSKSLIFNFWDGNRPLMSYLLNFKDTKTLNEFDTSLSIAMYEVIRHCDCSAINGQSSNLIDVVNNIDINGGKKNAKVTLSDDNEGSEIDSR